MAPGTVHHTSRLVGHCVTGALPRRILPEVPLPGTVAPVNDERDMGNRLQQGTFSDFEGISE
ncbi:hypothetical protein BFN03_08515 [Rhodococcus sp. WMMA185]|nr:hypothetical protein BFN03_08515 [Rhodococcus sp. WMMA185]